MSFSYLRDNYGLQYRIGLDRTDTYFHAHLFWKRARVGQIQWFINDENMLVLGNIEVFEQVTGLRNGWFFPRRWPANYFRRRGLGTAMLEFLIAQAEALGVAGIAGMITQADLRENPHLIEWYQKHGFTVDEYPNIWRSL